MCDAQCGALAGSNRVVDREASQFFQFKVPKAPSSRADPRLLLVRRGRLPHLLVRAVADCVRNVVLATSRDPDSPNLLAAALYPQIAPVETGQRKLPLVLAVGLTVFQHEQHFWVGAFPDQRENRPVG